MSNRLTIGYIKNGVLTPRAGYGELFKLDREQLSAIAKRIFENANRRLANLRARELTAYSSSASELGIRAFSARGKNNLELVKAIVDADNFLKQNDSSVKGARSIKKQVAERLPNLTEKERRAWIRLNDMLHEKYGRVLEKIHQNGYASEQYKRYAIDIFKSARGNIVGGIGGDLFSSEERPIKATAAEREKAFFDAMAKMEKYLKSVNDAMFPPVKQRGGVKKSKKFSAKDLQDTKIDIERV